MKINKLVGIERTLDMMNSGIPYSELLCRQTGRTTAIAFEYISLAMKNDGVWFELINHNFSDLLPCLSGHEKNNRNLLDSIRKIIGELDFKCFEFKITPPQMRFNLFEEYVEKIHWVKKSTWIKKNESR